jgi:hypothetical protein
VLAELEQQLILHGEQQHQLDIMLQELDIMQAVVEVEQQIRMILLLHLMVEVEKDLQQITLLE